MTKIYYIDRETRKKEEEKIYGGWVLNLFYGSGLLSEIFGPLFRNLSAKIPFFSKLYGTIQANPRSKKKVLPFIEKFGVDISEFEKKPTEFLSFNDFFTRKLKKGARPLAEDNQRAVLFADARYLFFPNISKSDGFLVKGARFCLKKLLNSEELANRYESGSMVIARLCPTDYHRFHFPFDCLPSESKLINGYLYSVNPIALKKNINYLTENKREITSLESDHFGTVQYIEVGATHVGSIHQTFEPGKKVKKGDEKGYFAFGGSCVILLFEPGKIKFDEDLLAVKDMEIRGLFGQSLGAIPE